MACGKKYKKRVYFCLPLLESVLDEEWSAFLPFPPVDIELTELVRPPEVDPGAPGPEAPPGPELNPSAVQ